MINNTTYVTKICKKYKKNQLRLRQINTNRINTYISDIRNKYENIPVPFGFDITQEQVFETVEIEEHNDYNENELIPDWNYEYQCWGLPKSKYNVIDNIKFKLSKLLNNE